MIYVLTGQTNSGKTTLLDILKLIGYENIVTYTTRPIRDREIHGIDYHFISEEDYEYLDKQNKLTAKFTAENGWKYGINLDDLNLERDYVVVLEPKGLRSLTKKIGEENITSIYLDVLLTERTTRGLKRDCDIVELVRRLNSDEKDFEGFENEVDFIIKSMHTAQTLSEILGIIDLTKRNEPVEQAVTISFDEYHQLVNDSRKLDTLEAYGVDNWSGYGDAMEEFYN